VGPAPFTRDEKTEALVPALRKNSEGRRSADPKFTALNDLMERVKKQQLNKEISLQFDERLKLAKDDKELQKLLEENDPSKRADETETKSVPADKSKTDLVEKTDHAAGTNAPATAAGMAKTSEKDAKKKSNDIVLNETLNILADWINSNENKTGKTARIDPGHN
jgi:ParB-like chromosome segregation protein Spo0J